MNAIKPEGSGKLSKPFRLDHQRGKLMGVCAGIGQYFGVDVTIVRIGFVVATLVLGGAPILLYLATGLIAD